MQGTGTGHSHYFLYVLLLLLPWWRRVFISPCRCSLGEEMIRFSTDRRKYFFTQQIITGFSIRRYSSKHHPQGQSIVMQSAQVCQILQLVQSLLEVPCCKWAKMTVAHTCPLSTVAPTLWNHLPEESRRAPTLLSFHGLCKGAGLYRITKWLRKVLL